MLTKRQLKQEIEHLKESVHLLKRELWFSNNKPIKCNERIVYRFSYLWDNSMYIYCKANDNNQETDHYTVVGIKKNELDKDPGYIYTVKKNDQCDLFELCTTDARVWTYKEFIKKQV